MKKVTINDDNCFKLHPWRVTPDGHYYKSGQCCRCSKDISPLSEGYVFFKDSLGFRWTERWCDKCFKKPKAKTIHEDDAVETYRLQ